jgi:hypothetical protein
MAADHKLMGSELAAKISAAPATAHNTTLTVNHNAVAGDQAYRGNILWLFKCWMYIRICILFC